MLNMISPKPTFGYQLETILTAGERGSRAGLNHEEVYRMQPEVSQSVNRTLAETSDPDQILSKDLR